jgi:2,4-dienoyl-CoA reductase-like NADH-dependent reductase (Old Yellow Enzyme family)
MGKLELRNRIIMAPMTRMRAANAGYAPTELHAEYYTQRASAGVRCLKTSESVLDREMVKICRLNINALQDRCN